MCVQKGIVFNKLYKSLRTLFRPARPLISYFKGLSYSWDCPQTCTKEVRAQHATGKLKFNQDGEPYSVPFVVGSITSNFYCDKKLAEEEVGWIPNRPSPKQVLPEDNPNDEKGRGDDSPASPGKNSFVLRPGIRGVRPKGGISSSSSPLPHSSTMSSSNIPTNAVADRCSRILNKVKVGVPYFLHFLDASSA